MRGSSGVPQNLSNVDSERSEGEPDSPGYQTPMTGIKHSREIGSESPPLTGYSTRGSLDPGPLSLVV
jgi:hypothetical protein